LPLTQRAFRHWRRELRREKALITTRVGMSAYACTDLSVELGLSSSFVVPVSVRPRPEPSTGKHNATFLNWVFSKERWDTEEEDDDDEEGLPMDEREESETTTAEVIDAGSGHTDKTILGVVDRIVDAFERGLDANESIPHLVKTMWTMVKEGAFEIVSREVSICSPGPFSPSPLQPIGLASL
jgi:hypothetical protein